MFDSVVKDISDRVGRILGHVIVDSLPATPAGTNVIGHVIVDSAGNVTVTSLPSLPAGSALIGHVIADSGSTTAVTSLPALPTGTNVIGHVIVDSAGSVSITSLPSLPAGSNVIGHVIADAGSTTAITGTVAVTGTFWQATQPVSMAADTVHSLGAGAVDATTLRVISASDGPTVAALGTTSDAAVTGDTSGSINGHLRGITKQMGVQLPAALTGGGSLKTAPVEGLYQADVTLQNPATGTGNGTAMDVSGLSEIVVQISGTFSATYNPEATVDGINWVAVAALDSAAPVLITAGASTGKLYRIHVAGYKQFRLRISAYTSGSLTAIAHGITDGAPVIGGSTLYGSTGLAIAEVTISSDTIGTGSHALVMASAQHAFSGSNWERWRNNLEGTALASAARTTTTASADQTNYNGRGLILIVNVSSAGTGSITPTLQIKDSISGNYVTVWTAAAALVANGTYAYQFYPGAADVASYTESKQLALPRTWRANVTANNVNSVTYSVSVVQLV